MANKYTRKAREGKATDEADEFVSFWQKVYDFVIPYTRPIVLGGVGFVAVLGGVWTIDHFVTASHEESAEELGRALRIAEAELLTDADKDKDKDKDKDAIPRFKTIQERSDAAVAALDKLDKDHGSSSSAKRGAMLRAGLLFDAGKLPEAEAAYKKFIDDVSEDDSVGFVAREGVGLCQEAAGKLDDALATYTAMEKIPDMKDRVLYDEARVTARKGDKKRAAELYKSLVDKTPASPLKDDAEARLAALEG